MFMCLVPISTIAIHQNLPGTATFKKLWVGMCYKIIPHEGGVENSVGGILFNFCDKKKMNSRGGW